VALAAGLAAGNIVEIDNLLTAYLPTNALRTITTFTATAGQSAFSVSYTQGLIDVFYNGSCLAQSEYIAINGTSVTLVTACQVNDIVVVYAYSYSVGAYSGIGGSGTSGQVPYFTSSSAIASSPNHFWDATNNRLGIGTNAPAYILDVKQATNQHFYVGAGITVSGGIALGGGNDAANANIPIEMRYATTFAFVDGGTETMRISGANVGIGTSSPNIKLTINAGSSDALSIRNADTNYENMVMRITGGVGFIAMTKSGTGSYLPLSFYTSDTERMRITSGGGVYFGTTGGINANINYEFRASQSNGGVAILSANNTSTFNASPSISCYKGSSDTSSANRFIQFYCNGESQAMGGIVGNGASNVQFASISDIREKENIISIVGSLNKILALNPVEFNWIKNKEHIKAGFIAQQVEEVFPEYVVENMSNDSEEERKGLTGGMSSGIIAHLVKAIQEMNTKIIQLEKIVATK
jgi:hypothetical protein